MGTKKKFVVAALAVLTGAMLSACGGGSPLPDLLATEYGADEACKAISVDDVNKALGVDDIKLLHDAPFDDDPTTPVSEGKPGRECGYFDRIPEGIFGDEKGMHGIAFTMSEFTDEKWKFDDGDAQFEKVDVGGDEAVYVNRTIIAVHHGKWVVLFIFAKPDSMSRDDYQEVFLNLARDILKHLSSD